MKVSAPIAPTRPVSLSIRNLWIVLTIALVATFVLAACGGATTPAASTTPTAAATTAPPTPTTQPTTATTPTQVVQVKMIEQNGKYAFQPSTITIPKGAQVVWTNTSDEPHTVTSDTNAFTASQNIAENQTFSMIFNTAGTFAYHCSIHTYMTANIVVQ